MRSDMVEKGVRVGVLQDDKLGRSRHRLIMLEVKMEGRQTHAEAKKRGKAKVLKLKDKKSVGEFSQKVQAVFKQDHIEDLEGMAAAVAVAVAVRCLLVSASRLAPGASILPGWRGCQRAAGW